MGPDGRPRPSMDGIQRPQLTNPAVPPSAPDPVEPQPQAEPAPSDLPRFEGPLDLPPEPQPKSHRRRNLILVVIAAVILVLIAAVGSAYAWYQSQLSPVTSDATKHIRVTIKSGTSPNAIAEQLQTAGVIRSKTAFGIYTKLSHTENKLIAGSYSLQPSLSTQAIVDHLVSGKQDTFDVTFLPGDTLANNRQKLIDLGYTATDVDEALNKSYNRPLFTSKPASADLEGYLFGETIEFDSSVTVEQILGRFFDEYEDVISTDNLVAGFQKQGLSLYQGITLASIVQREVSNPNDQKQVARVFLNRIAAGMTLGSDVTYQYAAKKLGVAPNPNLDSPYNTRLYKGLPPGPIATPGVSALRSVANPGDNDYLFFLSGDDDVTYFAKTDAQHQQNIANHCQKKCSIN